MKPKQILGLLLLAILALPAAVLPWLAHNMMALQGTPFSSAALLKLSLATQTTLIAGLFIGILSSILSFLVGVCCAYQPRLLALKRLLHGIPVSLMLILFLSSWHTVSNTFLVTSISLCTWIWTSRRFSLSIIQALESDRISFARLAGHSEFTIFMQQIFPFLHAEILRNFLLQLSAGTLLFTTLCALSAAPGTTAAYSLGTLIHQGLTGISPLYLPAIIISALFALALNLLEYE